MSADPQRRLLAALRRALRVRQLEEGERSGWPLPREVASHLYLYALGLLGKKPEDPDAKP